MLYQIYKTLELRPRVLYLIKHSSSCFKQYIKSLRREELHANRMGGIQGLHGLLSRFLNVIEICLAYIYGILLLRYQTVYQSYHQMSSLMLQHVALPVGVWLRALHMGLLLSFISARSLSARSTFVLMDVELCEL